MITRPQAAAAADLLRTITPGWDARATTDTLLELCEKRPFREVMWAAITQASDPANRSPRTIPFSGSHWPEHHLRDTSADRDERIADQAAARAEARRCDLCDEHGYLPGGLRCPHEDLDQRAARARTRANEARAQIRPGPARVDLDRAAIGRPQHPAEPRDTDRKAAR